MGTGTGLVERASHVLHQRALVVDGLAAVALTAGALVAVSSLRHDQTVAVTVISAIACTTSMAWRRIAPLIASLVALTAVAAYQISGHDTQGAFIVIAVVLTGYSVGRTSRSRLQPAAIAFYALVAVVVIQLDAGFSARDVVLTWIPISVLPLAAGVFVARRAALADGLLDARARLADEQVVARARAITAERTRVARELHDVVAHCVSVMVIQAGGARLLATSDADAARAAMRVVVTSGREALADLRRAVGVRRRSDDAFAGSEPRLAQLPQLVERIRAAGTPVRLRLEASVTVSPDVDLAAFRIVQESLTNVRKHAPSATAEVTVTVHADRVQIAVEDTGPASGAAGFGTGQGLVGMRERVALHGGQLDVGLTRSGGFAVRAMLPLTGSDAAVLSDASRGSSRRPPARRLNPMQVDALLALAWLVPLEVEAVTSSHRVGPVAVNAAVVAAIAAAGIFRRRTPISFLLAVAALTITLTGGIAAPQRSSVVGAYLVLVGAYTVAAYCGLRRAGIGLGLLLAGICAAIAVSHAPLGTAFGAGLMACVVWIAGRVVRNQRQLVAELRDTNDRLAAEHDSRTDIARSEERVRIARDLHTIVARQVTSVVVHAEAVEDLLATNPAAAADAMAIVEQTGRQALEQLRRILGVLRHRGEAAPRQPQVGPPVLVTTALT